MESDFYDVLVYKKAFELLAYDFALASDLEGVCSQACQGCGPFIRRSRTASQQCVDNISSNYVKLAKEQLNGNQD